MNEFDQVIASFTWTRYSKKLASRIERPHNVGFFDPQESEQPGMRLVVGCSGSKEEGNAVMLFLQVDTADGVIVDACFQVFGQSALIGAAEIVCDLLVGKNYDQARRIGVDLIDKFVRDHANEPAFPSETMAHLSLVLEAVDYGASQCLDIPLAAAYAAPPAPRQVGEVLEGGYPGWKELTKKQQMSVIEEVMNQEIRPYIALDGGGVELMDLVNDDLLIAYQGNCTSCFSSVGATLSYIQQVIRAKVHPDLRVIPS